MSTELQEAAAGDTIVFDNASKFYGEVLGINRVTLTFEPGITGLVGPNGSGKTTLMNLMTGLLRPTQGDVRVLLPKLFAAYRQRGVQERIGSSIVARMIEKQAEVIHALGDTRVILI